VAVFSLRFQGASGERRLTRAGHLTRLTLAGQKLVSPGMAGVGNLTRCHGS